MKPPKLFLRPNIMRVSPWAALFLVVLLFAVAHHIIVGKTTQLTGYIVAATPKQRIEHEKGGIVQEILVQQGDHVKAGQLLIRLDPTATQQTLRYMQAGRLAQHLRRVRLEALSAEATPDETASYAPKRQESATPPAEHTFIHHQAQLLHAQQRARKQQEQLLTLTIDALQTEIDALAGQETFSRRASVSPKSIKNSSLTKSENATSLRTHTPRRNNRSIPPKAIIYATVACWPKHARPTKPPY